MSLNELLLNEIETWKAMASFLRSIEKNCTACETTAKYAGLQALVIEKHINLLKEKLT